MKASIAEAARAATAMENAEAHALATAKATQSLVDTTQQSSKAVNRAYLYIIIESDTLVDYTRDEATAIEITWKIRNFGKTPGYMVGTSYRAFVDTDFAIKVDPDFGEFGRIILGEGEDGDRRITIAELPVLPESNVKSGLRVSHFHYYFWGALQYTDIFGDTRYTAWCFIFDTKKNMLMEHGGSTMNYRT